MESKQFLKRSSAYTLIVLLLGSLLFYVPPSDAVSDTIALNRVKWDHSPITVYIEAKGNADPIGKYAVYVKEAFDDWLDPLGDKYEVTFLSSPASKRQPADIYVVLKKNTGTSLGTAFTSSNGGIIEDVKINLATQNALGLQLDEADFRTIARHEIGHAWGLGHTIDDDKVKPIDLMHPSFDFTENTENVKPSECSSESAPGPDVDAVDYIYATLGFGGNNEASIASTYSCSGGPGGGNGGNGDNGYTGTTASIDIKHTRDGTATGHNYGSSLDTGTYAHRDSVHIFVKVTDSDNNGVSGVSVHVVIVTPDPKKDLAGDATTNSEGIAHLHYKVNAGRDGSGASNPYHIEAEVNGTSVSCTHLDDDICPAHFTVE